MAQEPTIREIIVRFTSRKFLLAVAAFIAGLFGVFRPEAEGQARFVTTSLAEGVALMSPALFIIVEGLADAIRARKIPPAENTPPAE